MYGLLYAFALPPSLTPLPLYYYTAYRVGAVEPQGPADQEQEPPGPLRGDAADATQVYTYICIYTVYIYMYRIRTVVDICISNVCNRCVVVTCTYIHIHLLWCHQP